MNLSDLTAADATNKQCISAFELHDLGKEGEAGVRASVGEQVDGIKSIETTSRGVKSEGMRRREPSVRDC